MALKGIDASGKSGDAPVAGCEGQPLAKIKLRRGDGRTGVDRAQPLEQNDRAERDSAHGRIAPAARPARSR